MATKKKAVAKRAGQSSNVKTGGQAKADISGLQQGVNRLFEGFSGSFMPSVDVRDSGASLHVEAELPGMREEDVDVLVSENAVVLEGERQGSSEKREDGYTWTERSYGSFHREIPLPVQVNPEQAQASYHDGILEVIVPKVGDYKTSTKKIPVRKA